MLGLSFLIYEWLLAMDNIFLKLKDFMNWEKFLKINSLKISTYNSKMCLYYTHYFTAASVIPAQYSLGSTLLVSVNGSSNTGGCATIIPHVQGCYCADTTVPCGVLFGDSGGIPTLTRTRW